MEKRDSDFMTEGEHKKQKILDSVREAKKMELYVEHRTQEMKVCFLCEKVCYRRTPVTRIGKKYVCIDCIRQLKETLDGLKQWEEELSIGEQMKKQLETDLSL